MIILGLYNEQRGIDSCGYYYNGNIEKAAFTNAKFSTFISQAKFFDGDLEMNSDVFLGHTRKMSIGAKSIDNAHPHEAGSFVQVHNGTIDNIRELTTKYEIKDLYNVDSLGLAKLIEKEGFKILEEYVGSAALAMTYQDDPEKLYLFHGQSTKFVNDNQFEIERPLFVLEQPEGLYFSSIEESLMTISNDDSDPYLLPCNKVFEIMGGEFTDFDLKIDRWYKNVKPIKKHLTTVPKLLPAAGSTGSTDKNDLLDLTDNELPSVESIIYNRIDVRCGRYYANDKLLEGEYQIERSNNRILNKNETSLEWSDTFYFIKGIMMKDRIAYKEAMEFTNNIPLQNERNIAMILSPYGRYPVFSLDSEALGVKDELRKKWYENGTLLLQKKTVAFKFTNKLYSVGAGKTVEIRGL